MSTQLTFDSPKELMSACLCCNLSLYKEKFKKQFVYCASTECLDGKKEVFI